LTARIAGDVVCIPLFHLCEHTALTALPENNGNQECYAEREGTNYRLRAVRIHTLLRGIFPKATIGGLVSDFISDPVFVLNGGTEFERIVSMPCQTSLSKFTQRFRFICEKSEQQTNKRGFFITLQGLEEIPMTIPSKCNTPATECRAVR
jgi:hypothetical protein